MKTFKRLYEEVCSGENLREACEDAARGRRSQPRVAAYLFRQESRLSCLREALLAREYRPPSCRVLFIRDPKPRVISVAPFESRVVHHALCRVILPLLAGSFIRDSYACLPHRGAHRAILRHEVFMRRHRYLMQVDVAKYFPSISHRRLLDLLGRTLHDEGVLWLCRRILEAQDGFYFRKDVLAHLNDVSYLPEWGKGIPVGFLTSQVWGNVYLNSLDHFVKRTMKVPGYLRYMDDLTLFADKRYILLGHLEEIKRYLKERLGLDIRLDRIRVKPCTGKVRYLGYRLSRAGHEVWPATLDRLQQRLAHVVAEPAAPRTIPYVRGMLASYRGISLF